MGCKDRLVWPYSATGEYCAKTGYMLARVMQKEKMKVQQKEECSKRDGDAGVWKFI